MDEAFMDRAIELAQRGEGFTSPNPMVGAVIVREGKIVGEGFHRRVGEQHAEIVALQQAGEASRGSTLYVNLEPCAHYGRTPPCTEAIINSGVAKVVAAMVDPNPLVSGRGIARLREAGIEVVTGVREEKARKLNEVFIKFITTGLPFTVLKIAMTLDGKIASRTGDSRWITGKQSRELVHRWRHKYDAVMVGINTVLTDNPRLSVRLPGNTWKNPRPVVVDSRLRFPSDCNLARSQPPAIIATVRGQDANKVKLLRELGLTVMEVAEDRGRVDVAELFALLGKEGITSVLVEGGGELAASLLEAGLVDKLHVFIAPKIIGGRSAPTPVGGRGIALMQDAIQIDNTEITVLDGDILVTGYYKGGEKNCSPVSSKSWAL